MEYTKQNLNGRTHSQLVKAVIEQAETNKKLRKAMYALFSISIDTDMDIFIDILTDALLGEDLFRTYEEHVSKGEQAFKEIMESYSV